MNTFRNLLELNEHDFNLFLNSFDTVLTDCDGVLWIGESPIPGVQEVLNKFQTLGKNVIFVTNNATRTVEDYIRKFTSLGYNVKEDQIFTPSIVISLYLQSKGFNRPVYVLGSKAFCTTIENAGIQPVMLETDWKEASAGGIVRQLHELQTDVGAVILDFDPCISYIKLMQAKTLLESGNCEFIVGATECDIPLAKDVSLLGPGYFAEILQKSTGCTPIIIGKPSTILIEMISKRHSIVPARTLFIGDTLLHDIAQGSISGFQTLLVLSGVSTLNDVKNSVTQPQYIVPSLGALLPAFEENKHIHY